MSENNDWNDGVGFIEGRKELPDTIILSRDEVVKFVDAFKQMNQTEIIGLPKFFGKATDSIYLSCVAALEAQ